MTVAPRSGFRLVAQVAAAAIAVAGLAMGVAAPASGANLTATVAIGTAPFAVATTPDGTKAYVASSTGNSVSVIDLGTNTVTATIAVGTGPTSLAVTANGSRVYVANPTSNNVSVINTATDTVVTTIAVPGAPYGVASTPDSTNILVTRLVDNKLSTISTATNTVTSEVAVGAQPRLVAVSPNGTRAYVVNFGGNSVSVVDLASNTVAATVAVGASPLGVVVGRDGSAYIANAAGNSVSVIGTGNTVSATIPVPGTPAIPALSQDGATLYTTRFALNSLGVIRLSDNSITSNVAVGTQPVGLSTTSDGTRAVVGNQGSNNVSIVALAPRATTAAATAVTGTTATGNGRVTADTDAVTDVSCRYATSLTKLNSGVASDSEIVTATPNTVTAGQSANVTCSMTDLTPGTDYFYKVLATDADGTAGQVDAVALLTVPAKVATPSIKTKKKRIILDWSEVASATSYDARIKPRGGSYGSWRSITTSKVKFTKLARKTTYKSQLRAVNATGAGTKRTVTATTK